MTDIERAEELAQKLATTFFDQANPDNWTAAELSPAAMTKEQRGDRNWDVKNANQMGALLMRVIELKQKLTDPDSKPPPTDAEPDKNIAAYEKQAKQMIAQVSKNSA